jgi:hypothetical protein
MCKTLTTYQAFCNSFCTAQNSAVPAVSGATTLSKFEILITELLGYLKVYQLLVDGLDHLRIQILRLMLTGEAGE